MPISVNLSFNNADKAFMNRALQLAANGLGQVSPNPMVGAVIVAPNGKIIGEGFHCQYSKNHAEINALNSVCPEKTHLIPQSTIYVTLEPCSHYGKTPPCSKLIIEKRFKRVVVAAKDPFEKVDGRGLNDIQNAGIDVSVGLMKHESESLNARFFTAHRLKRPFITLKWAQSLDGYMDRRRSPNETAFVFSSPTTKTLVHRLRAHHDAIAIGSATAIADKPRLDVRYWKGSNPKIVFFDRRGRLGTPSGEIHEVLKNLYSEGITSVLIEGGATILSGLISMDLWDLARIEVSPFALGSAGTSKAPGFPAAPFNVKTIGDNNIYYFSNNPLVNNYFIDNGL